MQHCSFGRIPKRFQGTREHGHKIIENKGTKGTWEQRPFVTF